MHLRRRYLFRASEAGPESIVYLGRPQQLKRHFFTARAVNVEEWGAGEFCVIFKQAEGLAILPESGAKTRGLFPGKLNHAQFCDHDRPAEDRNDAEQREDDLAGDSGVFEREEKTAGR
jgi:hypothetical protein